MDFLTLKDISERGVELVNPTSPEKILTMGRVAGLREGSRVIDFGSGFGEVLALWAQNFGIAGIGIDVRPNACERAMKKMAERGLSITVNLNSPLRRSWIDIGSLILQSNEPTLCCHRYRRRA
jgi:tRNA G46 methylase TrmB